MTLPERVSRLEKLFRTLSRVKRVGEVSIPKPVRKKKVKGNSDLYARTEKKYGKNQAA